MDADEVKRYICETFDGVEAVEGDYGDTFFYYRPDGEPHAEPEFPFTTIVTGDHYERVSRLGRPGAYRLNIGLTKDAYVALFGDKQTRRDQDGVWDTGFDYAATDTVMPHPIYASQYWVCVVNPGEATMESVPELLAVAHGFAARKYASRLARGRH